MSRSLGIQNRKQEWIDYYADSAEVGRAKSAFWLSAAKFYKYEQTGKVHYMEEARAIVRRCLPEMISAFGLTGGLYNYLTFKHLYDEDMLTAFRECFTKTDLYDKERYTANHLLMSAVDLYLADQLFPGEIDCVIFEQDPNCKNTLLRLLDEYVRDGDPEWNSGSYFAVHYACLRMLALYAKDTLMADKAAKAGEWMLTKAAVTWMDGHIALSKERAYKAYRAQEEGDGGTILLWLYFGGRKPLDHEGWFNIHAMLDTYEPPEPVCRILEEKPQRAVCHREKHVYHMTDRIHFYDPNLRDEGRCDLISYACLSSYMKGSYGVYSSAEWVEPANEYVEYMDRFYIQMHRWGVCFTGLEGPSVFFMENPSGAKTPDVGASAWERVMQDQGTLMGIYHIPSDRPDRYLECFLPKDRRTDPEHTLEAHLKEHKTYVLGHVPTNYVSCINECGQGQLYLDYGGAMLALCMTGSFVWEEGTSLFKRDTENLAYVVEVSDAFETLLAFREAVKAKWSQANFDEKELRMTYKTLMDRELSMSFAEDGTRDDCVNGIAVGYEDWDLVENPWMKG